MVSLHSFKLVG